MRSGLVLIGLAAAAFATVLFVRRGASVSDPVAGYAGSARCAVCHEAEFEAWKESHHALAERPVDLVRDRSAFEPERRVEHGSRTSAARTRDAHFELVTLGAGGTVSPHPLARAIGVSPLRQYLVPAPGGRWQATDLAYDPREGREEWFDVFAGEERRPEEWGFWANRGMNWNSMCATCHVTALRKNYDAAADAYDTRWTELGAGCEACHGPSKAHVEWQERRRGAAGDPTVPRVADGAWVDTCGACHSRRVGLVEPFRAGESFLDQFHPDLPDHRDVYYPDGQVRDENYEYVSFLLSRMYGMGVRCIDCHEPHSAKTRATGNDLCMRCHQGKVDPAEHSHHRPGEPGGRCVDCHMPLTTYMQRHERRDHGFTIPDPLLTKELGIPNACNRCHTSESVDWAVAAVERWYGDRMDRVTRRRARAVAAARGGDASVIGKLVERAQRDPLAAWRAVAIGLLGPWADRPEVARALEERLVDPEPLVRLAAAGAAEPVARAHAETLRRLWNDPVRAVRVQAAWALRGEVDLASDVGRELRTALELRADQPPGALMLGMLWAAKGEPERAAAAIRRAIRWEPANVVARHALADLWLDSGRDDLALAEIEAACRDIPDDAELHHQLGLLRVKGGRLEAAESALARACELEARFAAAWYDLALVRLLLGRKQEAAEALERALRIEPSHAGARAMLAEMRRSG